MAKKQETSEHDTNNNINYENAHGATLHHIYNNMHEASDQETNNNTQVTEHSHIGIKSQKGT